MESYRAVRRVLWITMGLNLVATAAKLIVGYWTGSLSLIADGFDSVFDSASNVVGLVGIYLAARPADEDHPYGHRKAETMTALIISSLLFLTTWELIVSAVERLRDPTLIQARVNAWSFGALLVSIVVHLTVVWVELRAGRRLHSDVLVADALHTRADIFVSLSVIGGLVAVRWGYPLVDPIMALVVALVIAKIGIDIIREGSPTLMDRVAVPPDLIRRIALSVPGVIFCHKVRSRGHETAVYVDLHIQVDPAISAEQAHAIAHEVQYRLHERVPSIQDVTIHAEPAGSPVDKEPQEQVAAQIRRLADELAVKVHDVWIYEGNGQYDADIHAEVDSTLSLREAHALVSVLEERARAEIPHLIEVTAHIEPGEQWLHVPDRDLQQADITQAVRQVAAQTPGTGTCHRIQARWGNTGWSVSMHCTLPGEISLAEAHRISTRLESTLRDKVSGLERVIIHTEPSEKEDELS
jgi:cation diffusion facilitator family transporter